MTTFNNPLVHLTVFSHRKAASIAAACLLAHGIRTALAHDNQATLIASGGSSPKLCFEHLSQSPIDWHRVHVTLTDERNVDVEDSASNERMVRNTLLQNLASVAKFVRLQDHAHEALDITNGSALVGMGEDGHFASIFPDMENRAVALDLGNPDVLISAQAPSPPRDRVSMTLSYLTRAKFIVLLIFGQRKLDVIRSPAHLPIGALLNQIHSPVHVMWAP